MTETVIKVLCIDDEPNICELVKIQLTEAGFQVATAQTGVGGLSQAKQNPPDIVLCDIMMSPNDGFAIHASFQENPMLRHIPFIFLSALDSQADKNAGLALGVDDYIAKPFQVEELIVRIRAIMRRKHQARGQGFGHWFSAAGYKEGS